MICKSCRNQVPDGMNRCPNCGGQIMVERTQQVNQVQPVMQNNYSQNTNMSSVQQPNRKSNKGLFFLLIIIIVVICVFVFKLGMLGVFIAVLCDEAIRAVINFIRFLRIKF